MSSGPGSLGIELQVQKLETIADPATRAIAMDLLASVLKLHGEGLERMLQIIEERSGNFDAVITSLRRDPLVRALLVLHDLNDESPEARVHQALEELEPQLERAGATASVLRLDATAARIRIRLSGHSCGSTAESVRVLVERAIVEAAPDMAEIEVALDSTPAAATLIPVSAIQPAAARQVDGEPAVQR